MENPIASGFDSPPPPPMTGTRNEPDTRRTKPSLVSVRWLPVKKNKPGERRFHHRHPAQQGAFALLRFNNADFRGIGRMSMGDIACAVFKCRPRRVGQIRDISLGGVSFSYVDGGECREEDCKLDILVAESAFYLEDLPFRLVTDLAVSEEAGFQVMKTKIVGLQFKNLSSRQNAQLKRFIRRYTL